MVQQIEIGINLIKQLSNLKKTFTDKLSFVEELIQNAQRGKASRLTIIIYEVNREVTFSDNGLGCDDLESLFTVATSGLNKDLQEEQDPFGTGFFSVIVVAGEVEIRSQYQRAIFDVDTMFNEERLDVVEVFLVNQKTKDLLSM